MIETSRAAHLAEVSRLLWPEPLRWTTSSRTLRDAHEPPEQAFVVIPSADAPRLIVPESPRLAATAVRNLRQGPGLRQRVRRDALAQVVRTRVGQRIFPDRLLVYSDGAGSPGGDSLKELLDRIVGANTHWAMPVSRARANRKPVLQLLGDDGRQLAYVKVGTNALTRALVRTESDSLRELSTRLNHTTVPEVIAATAWGALELLVLQPLPLGRSERGVRQTQVDRSAREIAESYGLVRTELTGSSYWAQLGGRLSAGPDDRSHRLADVWRRINAHCSSAQLTFGSWHGDWAPWNMESLRDRLLVWDFERFARDVPLGLDLVHFDLQTRILDPSAATDAIIAERWEAAPVVLRPLGITPGESQLTFTIYLLEIASRWIEDQQDAAGDWGGVLDGMVDAAGHTADRLLAGLGR